MKAKSSIPLNKSKWIFHFSLFTYKQMDFSLFTFPFSLFLFPYFSLISFFSFSTDIAIFS